MIQLPHRHPELTSPTRYAPSSPTVIDLFSGIGGWSLGALAAGCTVAAAYEQSPVAAYAYHANLCRRETTAIHRDATTISTDGIADDIDIIVSGPPCQPWSSASGKTDTSDTRRDLLNNPVQWTDLLNPSVTVIENVPNLKHQYNNRLHQLKESFADIGYTATARVLDAADYHVPQHRNRLFIIAVNNSLLDSFTTWFPTPTTGDPEQTSLPTQETHSVEPRVTAQEALQSLPDPIKSQPPKQDRVHDTIAERPDITVEKDGTHRVDPHTTHVELSQRDTVDMMPANHIEANHHDSTRHSYSEMPIGYSNDDGTGSTTDRRIHPNQPAQTMTCSNGTPPIHYQGAAPNTDTGSPYDVRRLTPREVARLQTFPDTITAAGTREEQFRQFANAVPPLLAAQLLHHIRTEILH